MDFSQYTISASPQHLSALFAASGSEQTDSSVLPPEGLQVSTYGPPLELTAEEAIRLCRSSLDIVCVIDFSGRVLWSNGAEYRITGFSPEELKDTSIAEITHPEDLQKVYQGLMDATEGVLHPGTEVRLRCKDGSFKWISWSGVPNFKEQKVYSIGRDITAKKIAELTMADFYSITSHELRTPLSSVRGVLSLLSNDIVEPSSIEGKELLGMALSSCDRLVRLVNDILDLRKIETGSIRLRKELVSAEDLLSCAIGNIKGVSIEANVHIKAEIEAQPFLYGDKDRLVQVLTNLLSNGVKYSPGGEQLIARIDCVEAGRVRFSVIDQGPGIPESELPKLFKKFGQLDSSDSRPKEGIGLGLFIARSITEEHNGRIGVQPREQGGSHFWFELPIHESFSA